MRINKCIKIIILQSIVIIAIDASTIKIPSFTQDLQVISYDKQVTVINEGISGKPYFRNFQTLNSQGKFNITWFHYGDKRSCYNGATSCYVLRTQPDDNPNVYNSMYVQLKGGPPFTLNINNGYQNIVFKGPFGDSAHTSPQQHFIIVPSPCLVPSTIFMNGLLLTSLALVNVNKISLASDKILLIQSALANNEQVIISQYVVNGLPTLNIKAEDKILVNEVLPWSSLSQAVDLVVNGKDLGKIYFDSDNPIAIRPGYISINS